MKIHFSNAVFGVLDYAAYPAGMLLVTPIVLHRLGAAEFGVWVVATALASTGGIIAAGFGDANIQQVSRHRASGEVAMLRDTVGCMIGINLTLGFILMAVAWSLAPFISHHVVTLNSPLLSDCVNAIRLASVLILFRALESVSISTQRAFERYGAAVGISLAARVLTLFAAGTLAWFHLGMTYILAATAALAIAGTVVQFVQLRRLLPRLSLAPTFRREVVRSLFSFGVFSWLQAVAGVVFGQADRLLLGVSLGATAVTSYSLCVQLSQPLYGLTAAALHFFFPYLAGRLDTISRSQLRKTVFKVLFVNLAFTAAGTILLLTLGPWLLSAWAGRAIAQSAVSILPMIVLGSALLGLSVTGTYVLLAFGRVRALSWISIGGGCAMLLLMVWLLPISGLRGLASARLAYGFASLLIYFPVLKLVAQRNTQEQARSDAVCLNEVPQL